MLAYAESSPSVVTPLNKHIGYEEAAKVAKAALKEGRTIREQVLEMGYVERGDLTEEELDAALDVRTHDRTRDASRELSRRCARRSRGRRRPRARGAAPRGPSPRAAAGSRRRISAASASPCGSGKSGSSVPCSTSVGASISAIVCGSLVATTDHDPVVGHAGLRGRGCARRRCAPRRARASSSNQRAPAYSRCTSTICRDARLRVAPSRRRRRRPARRSPRHAARAAAAERVGAVEGGGGRDQRQAADAVGVLDGDVLRDPAAHGDADQVGARDARARRGCAAGRPTGQSRCTTARRPASSWTGRCRGGRSGSRTGRRRRGARRTPAPTSPSTRWRRR